MPPWSLQNSQNWLIFSHVEKNCQKKDFFLCRATPTAWATHKNFFFRFMYPGTLNFVFSSNPCTRVHDILFFLQIHVPGYMEFRFFFKSMYPGTWNLDFYTILMCSSGGGGGLAQKKIAPGHLSSTRWATHKNSEKNQYIMYPGTWILRKIKIPCTRVHGFEEKSKFHVPGYMDLKKKQNIMYPGTWIWR